MGTLTPESCLEGIESGKLVKEVLSEHGEDTSGHKITLWKKTIPDFHRRYDEAMAGRKVGRPASGAPKLENREGHPLEGWDEVFLAVFAELPPDKRKIAEAVRGVQATGMQLQAGLVYARLSPKHRLYSKSFHERFLELEGALIAEVESVQQDTILSGRAPAQAQRLLENHPLTSGRWGSRPLEVNVNKREVRRLELTVALRHRVAERSVSLVEAESRLISGEVQSAADDSEDPAYDREDQAALIEAAGRVREALEEDGQEEVVEAEVIS